MRGLLILCLVTVALAAPQYNYQQQQSFGGSSHHGHAASAPAVWNKHFSIYSAPEDDLSGSGSDNNQSSLRRNLRVLFVRAPENRGLEDAALQLAKSASDDKTAVYVLTKQTDLGELQNKLAQSHDLNANKPEVHFVKYKTSEEAEHAQHSIRQKYNHLNGPTSISNEGIAPVESFVGSVPSSSSGYNYNTAVQNTYIPPPPPAPVQNTYIPPPAPPAQTYIPPPTVHNTYLPAFH